jgi:hypothetical protein
MGARPMAAGAIQSRRVVKRASGTFSATFWGGTFFAFGFAVVRFALVGNQ